MPRICQVILISHFGGGERLSSFMGVSGIGTKIARWRVYPNLELISGKQNWKVIDSATKRTR
jgi:hypothetical protein